MNTTSNRWFIQPELSYAQDLVLLSIPANGIQAAHTVEVRTPLHVLDFLSSYFILDWHHQSCNAVRSSIKKAINNANTIAFAYFKHGHVFQHIHLYVYGGKGNFLKGRLSLDEHSPPFMPHLLTFNNQKITIQPI